MEYYGIEQFRAGVVSLAEKIREGGRKYTAVFPVLRGGVSVAMALGKELCIPVLDPKEPPFAKVLVVDDIVDSGRTRARFSDFDFACLHISGKDRGGVEPTYYVEKSEDWIVYWWEGGEVASAGDSVTRFLEYIGEDPNRDGLRETPARVLKSWGHLFSGYKKKPEDVVKTFELADYDQMILCRDIELYSTCEHHLLPFIGKAHVAYIPCLDRVTRRVIGVSKLARVLEIYARRLQIQERLGEQVTSFLMASLNAAGVACIIEAKHLCMMARGVEKQNSVMVTSSLKGKFLEDSELGRAARQELMGLIGMGK
jgi:GTP cyclohydrolase I